MTSQAPNAELAYRTLDLIQANPEHFNMAEWSASRVNKVSLKDLTAPTDQDVEVCGSTACFAGWAIALSGYMVTTNSVLTGDGKTTVTDEVQEFAAALLGIDYEDSEYLFFVEDEGISQAVEKVFGPRPEPTS